MAISEFGYSSSQVKKLLKKEFEQIQAREKQEKSPNIKANTFQAGDINYSEIVRRIHEDRDRRLTNRMNRLKEMDQRIQNIFDSPSVENKEETKPPVENNKPLVEETKQAEEKPKIKPLPPKKPKKKWRY